MNHAVQLMAQHLGPELRQHFRDSASGGLERNDEAGEQRRRQNTARLSSIAVKSLLHKMAKEGFCKRLIVTIDKGNGWTSSACS